MSLGNVKWVIRDSAEDKNEENLGISAVPFFKYKNRSLGYSLLYGRIFLSKRVSFNFSSLLALIGKKWQLLTKLLRPSYEVLRGKVYTALFLDHMDRLSSAGELVAPYGLKTRDCGGAGKQPQFCQFH